METTDGRRVRKAVLFSLILHIILFFFSFAVVGFRPMVMNFLLACIAYSCYLTVREKEIVIYLVLLTIGSFDDMVSLKKDVLGNLQVLGKIINLVTYCLLLYVVGKSYYAFRHAGGLHGRGQQSNLIEDLALAKVKEISAATGGTVLDTLESKLKQKKAIEGDQEN